MARPSPVTRVARATTDNRPRALTGGAARRAGDTEVKEAFTAPSIQGPGRPVLPRISTDSVLLHREVELDTT